MEDITRGVRVRCSVERAFRVFTEEMGTWWPLQTHSISVDQDLPQKAVSLRVGAMEGGRIEEVLEDGSTREWATIVRWEPPRRVAYAWKPNDLPTPPTEVEVRFSADGETTVVELEHRGWDGLGRFSDEVRPLYASEGGWTLVLELYRKVAESQAAG